MITINIKTDQSIPCIVPEGRLDTVNSSEFDQAVMPLAEKELYLIIDFAKCNYMSSTGIRVLLGVEKKLKAKGGVLFISGISAEVFQVLEMAGLHQIFHFSDNCQSARDKIIGLKQKCLNCQEWLDGDYRFLYTPSEFRGELALVWNDQGIAGYNELGFSVGTGLAAESLEEGVNSEGLFITTGNSAGFIPNDKSLSPDFRFSYNTAQAGVLVKNAISFGQNPAGLVHLEKPSSISMQHLADALYLNGVGQHKVIAFVTVNFNPVAPTLSFCVIIDQKLSNRLNESGFHELTGLSALNENGICLWGARFEINEIVKNFNNPSLSSLIKETLTLDNIINVQPIDLSEILSEPLTWLFVSEKLEDASNHRIKIEAPADFFSEPYKAFLTRRLYGDSVRVVIKPLHGGYSAQTFQVASYDKDGRRLRPTVLKIANRAMITREADRCKQYSLPYIFNNSAMVLGTEFFGDFGALCYNFVGIGGEQTQLKWLTKYFEEWAFDKLEPLFDKTFIQILNPWYGQPVRKSIYPFLDHDPTLTFFPNLWESATKQFSISSDEPYITLEETGQKLVNPYWFLKHEYKKRRETAIDYYTSICHGDLNMQNILLDQDMNVYLIDFSETRPRSVVSDFARLEAIFMIEHAPTDNVDEMREIVEFVNRFYSIDRLDQLPENTYQGTHAGVMDRNVSLTLKMREYALRCTNGDTNLVPYYMALLEWILPIVCYYSATDEHKRLSMIVAGLLCEKVMGFNAIEN